MKETGYWTWFIISGLITFFILGLHMLIVHLDGMLGIFSHADGGAVVWENVIQRSRSQFFSIAYIILLGAALYHGFYGLRTILLELGIGKQAQQRLTKFLWLTGILLFLVGTYVSLAVRTMEAPIL